METVLDSEGIKRLLPHRYPFLLVDRIIELKPLERIVGIKQVSANESFFEGHFPSAPVMPGVLVIEALAQCGAIIRHRYISTGGILRIMARQHLWNGRRLNWRRFGVAGLLDGL